MFRSGIRHEGARIPRRFKRRRSHFRRQAGKVLLSAADAPVEAGIEGTIRQITYHGEASRIVLALNNGETVVALEKNDRRSGDRSVGSKVRAHWAPEDMKVFAR